MDISIIILSKNEERHIGSTLDMVFRQDTDRRYEVILIDSGSKDSTLRIARRYPVRILEIPAQEFGHGRTRNKGAQMAKGEIAVFLNADAAPLNEKWLEMLTGYFANDAKVAGVYSRVYPRPDCNPLRSWEILDECPKERQVRHIVDLEGYRDLRPRQKRSFLAFQTISCAIRRDLLLEYPFKDIEFGEDLEWSKRIMEKGFKIAFEPESAVFHSHDFYRSLRGTFRKYFDDAELNNDLLDIWPWMSLPLLAVQTAYKIVRDAGYISGLDRGIVYKAGWIFYSPVIRTAEFFGIISGANSRHIPQRLRSAFSMVNETKRR